VAFRWTFQPFANFCAEETVTRDGLGLPGHHGCGAKKARSNAAYLG
jgi:hypothetical protein